MSFMKTNSVKITVDGQTYDSLEDYGLAIGNTDYIEAPVLDTDALLQVPGRNGLLDITDTIFSDKSFTHRKIKIEFGGVENPEDWDSVISEFRTLFEGKIVELEFATMPNYFFKGRAAVEAFSHQRALGTFTFSIPYADPCSHYKRTATMNNIAVNSAGAAQLINGIGRSGLTVISGQPCTVQLRNSVYQVLQEEDFLAGTHEATQLEITPEASQVRVINTGTEKTNVSVIYYQNFL